MSNNDLHCSSCHGQHHPADECYRKDLMELLMVKPHIKRILDHASNPEQQAQLIQEAINQAYNEALADSKSIMLYTLGQMKRQDFLKPYTPVKGAA